MKTFALILIATLIVPGQAQAFEGVMVAGDCTSSGPIASAISVMKISTQLATMQTGITYQLHTLGMSVASQEGALISTIQSEFKNQNNIIRHSANASRIGQLKAQQALAMAPNQQPQNLCDAPGLGAGLQVGSQTNADLAQKIALASNAHNTRFTRPIDASSAILKSPAAVFGPAPLFPTGGSLSSTQVGTASQWIDATTAPNPLPALPASVTGASAARYQAAVRVDTARLSVPQNTLAIIEALHAATMNVGTWTSDTWAAMTDSNKGTPPGVVNGRISDNALTRLMVNSRYANPSWYVSLATKNTQGLLREVAMMDAARMHMQYTQLRLTERMATMLAQIASQDANRAARKAAGPHA